MTLSVSQRNLLKQLEFPINETAYNVLCSCFFYLQEAGVPLSNAPVLDVFDKMSKTNKDTLTADARPTCMPCELPYETEDALGREKIKSKAAFYTGSEAVNGFIEATSVLNSEPIILCDPFCGGGAVISLMAYALKDRIKMVYGFEIEPIAALSAYVSTLHSLDYDYHRVHVILGDAFATSARLFSGGGLFASEIMEKPNVIATNPPFLSWSKTFERTKSIAINLLRGYDNDNANFTATCVFLCDFLLRKGGVMNLILPLSLFYNNKTKTGLEMIYDRYDVKAMFTRDVKGHPYSLKCAACDVLFVSTKEKSNHRFYAGYITDEDLPLIMRHLKTMDKYKEMEPVGINEESDYGRYNPSAYVIEPKLSALCEELYSKTPHLYPLKTLEREYSGKKMINVMPQYSGLSSPTDMWYLPNKMWSVEGHDKEDLLIKHGETLLRIPMSHVIPVVLRARYVKAKGHITDSTHYAIGFPLQLNDAERYYIESWEMPTKGGWWTRYRKGSEALEWTNTIITRVLNLMMRSHSGVAFYCDNPQPPTSAFMRISTGDARDDMIMASWWNSALFMGFLMAFGRHLSRDGVYITVSDIENLPAPNLDAMDEDTKNRFAAHVQQFEDVPDFWNSLPRPWDSDWMEWLGLSEETERLVGEMTNSMVKFGRK